MLDQLYITTARLDISADELEELPESGGIYRWLAPVNGLPECRVRHL
jgi:sugar lactone lactonase YvrE